MHGAARPPMARQSKRLAPAGVDDELDEVRKHDPTLLSLLSAPTGILVRFLAYEAELIFSTALDAAAAPVAALAVDSSTATSRFAGLLRRAALGAVAAVLACAVLVALMTVAAVLGVALVRLFVEEPVTLRRSLHFDYTQLAPSVAVSFPGMSGAPTIPPGHIVHVSLLLVVPESDYNLDMGVFQITGQALSRNGCIRASSSQPCILKFRSLPLKLTRTAFMFMPLAAGIWGESQKIIIDILQYTEGRRNKGTETITVRLHPRAGTNYLPQLYTAEMTVRSRLPPGKELVYRWKWTLYVWVSFYTYIVLLILTGFCLWTFAVARRRTKAGSEVGGRPEEDDLRKTYEDREVSAAVARWRERRLERRPTLMSLRLGASELEEGSALSAGDAGEVIDMDAPME